MTAFEMLTGEKTSKKERYVLLAIFLLMLAVTCWFQVGCSQVNTPAGVSSQILTEQEGLIVTIQATNSVAAQGLLKGSALQSAYNYENAAATAIAAADTAYQAGNTSTANIDITQAVSALASASAINTVAAPVTSATTAPATTKP